jgi:hypothetical protein
MFGSDYISVRWWGKVRADFDEPFTFYVNALTGVRLWIERSLLIDTWASTALVRPCDSSFCPLSSVLFINIRYFLPIFSILMLSGG